MNSFQEIKKQQKTYWVIGASLFVLTFVTVWASYWQLGAGMALFVALLIASVKGGLVANYFMHLNHEKQLVYFVLILTVLCFIILMAVPLITIEDGVGEKSPLIHQESNDVH